VPAVTQVAPRRARRARGRDARWRGDDALIGAGADAVYKGTTGLVLQATEPENRVAMTSDLVIAVFVGLSVPVIGAGVTLNQGASAPNTVLGFAILVALGISVSGWALLGRRSTGPQQAADLPGTHA
jgi:hypothetical protein